MNQEIKIRSACSNDLALIYSFIKKKSEFDRSIGAYSGIIQTSEDKIRQTIFPENPFAHVLFAENSYEVVGFALYAFRYSSFARAL